MFQKQQAARLERPLPEQVGGDWRNSITFETKDRFFGDIHKVSNKRFQIKSQNPSEDEAIIFTNNVTVVKGNPVLVTDNNKAVYLKDWNIVGATLEFEDDKGNYPKTFAVKISKKYFKEYTFQNSFDGMSFSKPDSWDSLKELAKKQEKQNKRISTRNLTIGRNGFI